MRVRIARSERMPTLYSYFVSNFSEDVLEHFKSRRPFSIYHRDKKEYEVTKDVYEEVATAYDIVKDEREELPRFERKHNKKYGYQEDAVDFAQKVDNLLINFPQGTGKSRTTMLIIDSKEPKKTLIVCGQSNLQEEWIKDADKHGYKEKLNFRIIGDSPDVSSAKKVKWILENKDIKGVDLINIEGLRNRKIIAALNEVGYNCVVVDEVQSAKGWKAAQTEGLHDIKEIEGQMRIALSGTPVLNGPLEFFSVLRFLRQLKSTARTTYERYYGEFGFDYWGHYVNKGFKNLDQLQELLKPVVAYVDKEELKLPAKKRLKVELKQEKSEELRELEKVYRMTTSAIKKKGFNSKPQIRAMIQVITSTAECKVNYIVDNFKNKKVLVFSQYVEALRHIQSQLTEKGKKVLLYTGELNMVQRLDILERWREGDYDILLLSIMSARYGLNLTEATDVVFLEPPFSMAILEQAEDRSHRIGQDLPVTSHLLVWSENDYERLDNIIVKQEAIEKVYSFLE